MAVLNPLNPRRFAVFSDVHGNLPALKAFWADVQKREVESLYCCGDLVGYGPFPNAVCDWFRKKQIPALLGNHDDMVAHSRNPIKFNRIAREAILWTREQITAENAKYLKKLPLQLEGELVSLFHASPCEPEKWHYILMRDDAAMNFSFFDGWIAFVGHTHQAFAVENAGGSLNCPPLTRFPLNPANRYLINVGSVGQPRDRSPELCYVLVDLDAMELEYCRVPYPIQETQAAIHEAGLPVELAHRLELGC